MIQKQNIFTEHIDSVIIPVASRWGMLSGSLTSIGGWVLSAQGIAAIGLSITILGFITNYYFQARREKRERELNELLKEESRERVKAIRNGKQIIIS